MKRKLKNAQSFFLGVLVTLLVFGMVVPALAVVTSKSIEVRSGIRVFVDDKELIPKDANGNQVEVFLYNGTTYLPARAVSEAIGKPIQWDGSIQGVYIGKHSSDTPAAWLAQFDDFNRDGSWEFDAITKDNLGTEHLHSIDCTYTGNSYAHVTYKLNGQYSRLTGMLYQEYKYRSSGKSPCTLVISGDGKELWRGTIGAGIDPVNIDIDVTGVLELLIDYPKNSHGLCDTALGDVALWS